ncbi:hypothetical protein KC358_g35 [Hortaea werneckii]|nr:hypothetical protein KC358_g35 [Hortaea werneckii]
MRRQTPLARHLGSITKASPRYGRRTRQTNKTQLGEMALKLLLVALKAQLLAMASLSLECNVPISARRISSASTTEPTSLSMGLEGVDVKMLAMQVYLGLSEVRLQLPVIGSRVEQMSRYRPSDGPLMEQPADFPRIR